MGNHSSVVSLWVSFWPYSFSKFSCSNGCSSVDWTEALHVICVLATGPGNSWTAWHCRTDSEQIHLPAQITKSRVGSESIAALNAFFYNQAPQQPTCERVRRQTCRDAGLSVVSVRSRTRLAV